MEDDRVVSIYEHTHIERVGSAIVSGVGDHVMELDPTTFVSMNFWVLQHAVLQELEARWRFFLEHLKDPQNDEFFLPNAIRDISVEKGIPIHLLKNLSGGWLGITYADDVQKAQEILLKKTVDGIYPKIF